MGAFNAVGPRQRFSEWLQISRQVGGHTGDVVTVSTGWLTGRCVGYFAGPESVAMWLPNRGMYGFFARNGDAARAAGLHCRPVEDTLAEVLLDERHRGLERRRDAGLSTHKERQLLAHA